MFEINNNESNSAHNDTCPLNEHLTSFLIKRFMQFSQSDVEHFWFLMKKTHKKREENLKF